MPIRYKRLFETIHVGILILDCKTRVIIDANPYFCELAGYTKEEIVGKKISQIGFFDRDITGKKIFNELEYKDEVIYEDIVLTPKKGPEKIVELGAHTYATEERNMVQCTVRDLTEKRAAQKDLYEANQRLEALLHALPVGVTVSHDPETKYITLNPYMERMMDLTPGTIISVDKVNKGEMLRHFIDGKEIKPKDLTMQRAIRAKKEIGPLEIEVHLPSGRKWHMEAVGAPILDRQGNVTGAVAVHTDLTERKKAQEADKLTRLMTAEKLKMDFINDAAHELRTPLAIIRGNVDLALNKRINTDEALKEINGEVLHLTDLLSDLSLLTTKENEFKRKLGSQKIDLTKLITTIAKRHERNTNHKNISIKIEELPKVKIIGDDFYLERLFTNIISNAISYGKENGRVRIFGKADSKNVSVTIEDDGVGISEKDLPHIFERFYRAESSRSKDFGGSGLGLAIVKWIAEAHGGTVTAKSSLGKGSSFTVIFPL